MHFMCEIKSSRGIMYSPDAIVVSMIDGSEYSFEIPSDDVDFYLEEQQVSAKGDFILNWANIMRPDGTEKNVDTTQGYSYQEVAEESLKLWNSLHEDQSKIEGYRIVLSPEFLEDHPTSDGFTTVPCRIKMSEKEGGNEYEFVADVDEETWIN